MTATCSLCREILDGGRAPALHADPAIHEFKQLGVAAQKHFAKRHPEVAQALNAITIVWVHYLLSLQLLFTDAAAIELQGLILQDLSNALNQPAAANAKLQVVDAVSAVKDAA